MEFHQISRTMRVMDYTIGRELNPAPKTDIKLSNKKHSLSKKDYSANNHICKVNNAQKKGVLFELQIRTWQLAIVALAHYRRRYDA